MMPWNALFKSEGNYFNWINKTVNHLLDAATWYEEAHALFAPPQLEEEIIPMSHSF